MRPQLRLADRDYAEQPAGFEIDDKELPRAVGECQFDDDSVGSGAYRLDLCAGGHFDDFPAPDTIQLVVLQAGEQRGLTDDLNQAGVHKNKSVE